MIIASTSECGDCGSRVLWLAEDEGARVVGIGRSAVIIPHGQTDGSSFSYDGEATQAFVSGHIVTIQQHGDKIWLNLPDGWSVPIPSRDVFASHHMPGSGSLLLLTTQALLRVDMMSHRIDSIDDNSQAFERVAANHGCIVAFRYGMRLYKSDGGTIFFDDRTYSQVAVFPDHVLAADPVGNVARIDVALGSEEPIGNVSGNVDFIYEANGHPLVVYSDGEGTKFVAFRPHRLAVAVSGRFNGESCAFIPSRNCIAVGTVEGVVLLWDTVTDEVFEATIEGKPRIVSMLWSECRQELFLGTRSGEVLVCTLG